MNNNRRTIRGFFVGLGVFFAALFVLGIILSLMWPDIPGWPITIAALCVAVPVGHKAANPVKQ